MENGSWKMENKNTSLSREKLRHHTEKVLEKVNHYARESHRHHVTLKDRHHRPFLHFPMSMGIILAIIFPILAGFGLAAFLMNDWKIHLERKEDE